MFQHLLRPKHLQAVCAVRRACQVSRSRLCSVGAAPVPAAAHNENRTWSVDLVGSAKTRAVKHDDGWPMYHTRMVQNSHMPGVQHTPSALVPDPSFPLSLHANNPGDLDPILEEINIVERELRMQHGSQIDPNELLEKLQNNPFRMQVTPEVAVAQLGGFERVLRNLESPVVDVTIPQHGKVVVVGDTHGQILDVLHIFATQGPPSASTVYVFNGDIVDRGQFAVEIWLLVITFKIKYPRSIHVLKGNHEDELLTKRPPGKGGGFAHECHFKYGPGVYNAFLKVFKLLPLFAVIGGEVFVVHGGLPRSSFASLSFLRSLPSSAWRGSVKTPSRSNQYLTGEEEIVFDALWADPHDGFGTRRSKRCPVPVRNSFGEDVTHRFLDDGGLSLCIRSHEVPRDGRGFVFAHGQRLLTIFSASHYDKRPNRGGVAVLRRSPTPTAPLKALELEIVEHYLEPEHHPPKTTLLELSKKSAPILARAD